MESDELIEMLLNLKKNVELRRRVDKEGVLAYILIRNSHPSISKHVEASIISVPTTWMVESGLSAVVDVFCEKKYIGSQQQRNCQTKTE